MNGFYEIIWRSEAWTLDEGRIDYILVLIWILLWIVDYFPELFSITRYGMPQLVLPPGERV